MNLKTNFGDGILTIGQDSVRCNSHYITLATLRSLVSEIWLPRLASKERVVILPFSISEEFVSAFRCDRIENAQLSLLRIDLDIGFFDSELDNLLQTVKEAERLVRSWPELFSIVDDSDFGDSLDVFCAS